jgi:hypothetical protein
VAEDVRDLFAEYADAYVRGDRPSAADYLERAGERADQLATMIERFLVSTPPRPPAQEDRELLAAWLDTPLLELRKRRRLRVDEVVDDLMLALGIDAAKRQKLKLYYQRLEGGVLDPKGVSQRVWDVLEGALGGKLVRPPARRPVRLDAEVAFYRAEPSLAEAAPAMPQAAAPAPVEHDEVDELFLGPRA